MKYDETYHFRFLSVVINLIYTLSSSTIFVKICSRNITQFSGIRQFLKYCNFNTIQVIYVYSGCPEDDFYVKSKHVDKEIKHKESVSNMNFLC